MPKPRTSARPKPAPTVTEKQLPGKDGKVVLDLDDDPKLPDYRVTLERRNGVWWFVGGEELPRSPRSARNAPAKVARRGA